MGTPARPRPFDQGIRVRDSTGIAAGALLERPVDDAGVGDGAEVGGADEASVFLQYSGEALGLTRLPGGAAAGEIGVVERHLTMRSPMSVMTSPGALAFTRMPRAATSLASVSVSALIPAFET